MVLDSHLGISIGTDITFGGIGLQDILSIIIGDIGIVHGDGKDMDSTIQIIGTIDIGSEIIGDGMIETEETKHLYKW